MGVLSARSKYAVNPVDEDNLLAESIERKGKEVLKLNRGDPAVYFQTPEYIKQAYIQAIKENKTHYMQNRGIPELIEAVIKRYRRMYGMNFDEESVVITQGVSEALYFLNSALLNPNDRVILFRPYYTQYVPNIALAEGKEYMLDYKENMGWGVDADELERHIKRLKHTSRIKYIQITNPNNPTGTVLNKNTLKEIVDLANEHKLLLVSDEIYDEIIYNGARFTSIGELAKGIPHVIFNGASKNFDSTGFRIGFVIVPNDDKASMEVKKKMEDYAMLRVCANVPSQYATAEGMNNQREHKKAIGGMVGQIEQRVNFAMKLLNENQYLSTVRPNGAYYIFPRLDLKAVRFKSDKQFVDTLLTQEQVQITRGSGFGSNGHIRIVSLPPKEILEKALTKLNEFCRKRAGGVR